MMLSSFFKALPQHETLRRLVLMRTIALIGQALGIAIAWRWLGIDLPLLPMFTVMLLLVVFNGWTWRRMQLVRPAGDMALFAQLFVDVAALSMLLYFSGGATNPFVSFYLPSLAVSAAILPWRFALALAVFSLACYSAMAFTYVPLHVHDPDQAVAYHLFGMWANFALSAGLITWFVMRMSGALRARDAQLALAREKHLQSERILSLGTQAASTAHAMGTPLSTVAVIVGELRNEAKSGTALAAYSEDLAIIEAQIALCKAALGHMSTPDAGTNEAAMLSTWLQQFIEQWRLRHPAVRLNVSLPSGNGHIRHAQAIGQILLTLLDNAAQAVARDDMPIHFSLLAGPQAATILIKNEGRGIDADLLKKLGYEPVQSTSGGQGIGLMLAFATARQIGVTIGLASSRRNGVAATLTIPLA